MEKVILTNLVSKYSVKTLVPKCRIGGWGRGNTSCHTSGIGCCSTCQLSIDNDCPTYTTSSPPMGYALPNSGRHAITCWVIWSSQGCLTSPPLYLTFWYRFFPLYFGAKLVSITFPVRPEEALLALTSPKLVRTHV